MREPVFTETKQICVVVRDIEATMKTYVHEYGIGPWEIYEFNPDTVQNLTRDGQPANFAFRLAVTMIGGVQWELIEPLDDRSIYAEFLSEKGEGVHHVALGVPDYGEAVETMEAKGRRIVQGGMYKGATFAYLSTDEDLGVVTEIYDWPADRPRQMPDAVYP
jgi:methylmalonyl-CoA/ethylmalonyl-CoA epimerase